MAHAKLLPATSFLILALLMSPIFILLPQFSPALYESIMPPIKLLQPPLSFFPADSRQPYLFSFINVSNFTFLTQFPSLPNAPFGGSRCCQPAAAFLIHSHPFHWPNSRMPSRLRHFCSSFLRGKKGHASLAETAP
jgi:hypothetical protein